MQFPRLDWISEHGTSAILPHPGALPSTETQRAFFV